MAVPQYNRAKIVDENFTRFVEEWTDSTILGRRPEDRVRPESPLTGAALIEILESQIRARHLDLAARELRATNDSFYTIGSAGHEGNAAIGRLTRTTDPAFLHYRSGGFMMERSRKHGEVDPLYDTMLSVVASSEDPISGGRHKVWGSAPMWVLPQTSTIASHVPKAVGMAVGLRRAGKLGIEMPIPVDSLVVCSFGDASVNHSTALGAFNAAAWAGYQKLPVPILFVCEDNGLGISVRTPPRWIEATFKPKPGIKYFRADGTDIVEAYRVASEAVDYCRTYRRPVFLHLEVVRLLGHAGTDIESEYRDPSEIEATEARDPLLATARTAIEQGYVTAADVLEMYETTRKLVEEAGRKATKRPKLTDAPSILAPLAPYDEDRVRAEATRVADPAVEPDASLTAIERAADPRPRSPDNGQEG